MSTASAQVQFAIEFLCLAVSAAGLALVLLGYVPGRVRTGLGGLGPATVASRSLSLVGFVVAGASAFAQGSLVVSGDPHDLLAAGRLVAAAAVAGSVPGWRVGTAKSLLLWVGAAGWAGAGVVQLWAGASGAFEVLLAGGSIAVGAFLLACASRSIASRVAMGAATTLLLVVLVVAVALSAVISNSLTHNELVSLDARAVMVSAGLSGTSAEAIKDARFAASDLEGYFGSSNPDPLISFATTASMGSAIGARLQALASLYPVIGFTYANANGSTVVPTASLGPGPARAIASNPALASPACNGGGDAALIVAANVAWAAASFPECLAGSGQLLGAVVAAYPLDNGYLATVVQADPSVGVAVASPQSVLAESGPVPPGPLIVAEATRPGRSHQVGNRLVASVPIPVAGGSPPLALVASTPATTLLSTRRQLDRTLFLIALGGTVLALGFAVLVGDRLTAGVRLLTAVAVRISTGSGRERAEISGEDEVAVLGSAFDSMLDSVEAQATALQAAADDETRLRNRLEAVVRGMSDALIAVDSAGRVTDFNRAAEELSGVSSISALGRPVEEVVELISDGGLSLSERLAEPNPAAWFRAGFIRQPEGSEVPVEVSAAPLRGSGDELIGTVAVVRDMRREREVERMKTEFLSRVGHELRTPLTGIMGYADILLRKEVEPERAKLWHEEILAAGRRLLRIVEMLEFFASSGAGRLPLRPEPVDTRSLVNGVALAWSSRVPPNITLGRQVSTATPLVMADRRWLVLAVEELLDNAVKFSPEGGRILLSARPGDGAGSVEISVSDRGVGMTESQHAAIFGEFVQLDGSDTRRFGGLGLGLAVVQRIVEGHGGKVICKSAPGRGTVFTIQLPSAGPPPAVRAARSLRSKNGAGNRRRPSAG
jgi:PAS domain S-box-containing protein